MPMFGPSGGGGGGTGDPPWTGAAVPYADEEAFVESLGLLDPLRWRSEIWVATNSATTAPGLHGLIAMTAVGTASAGKSEAGIQYSTTTTPGAMASLRTNSGVHDGAVAKLPSSNFSALGSREIVVSIRFGLNGFTSTPPRFFVGLTRSSSAPANINPDEMSGSGSFIGVAISDASPNNLSFLAKPWVSPGVGSLTKVPIGLPVEPAEVHTDYHLDMRLTPVEAAVTSSDVATCKVSWRLQKRRPYFASTVYEDVIAPPESVTGVIPSFDIDIDNPMYFNIWATNNGDSRSVALRLHRVLFARRVI